LCSFDCCWKSYHCIDNMIEKLHYFYHSSVVTAWMMLLLPMTKEVLRKSIESVGCHFGRRRVGWMRTAFSLFEWTFGYIIVQQHPTTILGLLFYLHNHYLLFEQFLMFTEYSLDENEKRSYLLPTAGYRQPTGKMMGRKKICQKIFGHKRQKRTASVYICITSIYLGIFHAVWLAYLLRTKQQY